MKVIILLAGMGTRFLPLSATQPKPLIPVGGAPVLAHILATLKPLNISELVLITGHLSDQIEAYVSETYDGPVSIVPQTTLDGTGGAVFAAREHIDCPVLIIFGDTIFDADLTALNDPEAENTIWTRAVEDFQRFGIVQTNDDGDMAQIVEKPQKDIGRQANIGLYYIKDPQALRAGLDHVMAGRSVRGEFFFTYALNHMVQQGHKINVRDVEGWHDCGTLDAILATNNYLLSRPGAAVPPPAMEGVTLVPPVLISKDATVRDCRVGPNVTIGAGTVVSSCTLAHTMVDAGCILENVISSHNIIGPDQALTDQEISESIFANGKVAKAP